MIVSIILFVISFIFLFIFIIMLIMMEPNTIFILSMFLSPVSFLFGSVIFYKITNKYPLNNISEYYTKKFKKLLIKTEGIYVIRFIKKNGLWVCENNSQIIKLNLGKYLFQKSYLISYVVRNLRLSISQ